ncbi:MAG: hypothetical protein VX231_06665, partial [Pseudomonadota bacterium]|nr:hypothetical protein [Pseudomonadota bacterium]
SEDAIRNAINILNPPTISNIIAMESPPPKIGSYTKNQIEFILRAAFTGFRAAVQKSQTINPNAKVSIHTGYWGCGAYGGNRELMPLLQLIAANLSGVDLLHFHTGFDDEGYLSALKTFDKFFSQDTSISTNEFISYILESNYQWGVSDGN